MQIINSGGAMGEQYVSTEHDSRQAQAFMKSLLADVSALERMIEAGRIESGVRRIGAEQEMFLIDRAMRPAPAAMEVLKRAGDRRLSVDILEGQLGRLTVRNDGKESETELISMRKKE